jgi:hypothetical protein
VFIVGIDPSLVLEVITRSGGLDGNLAPLLHENSKLWAVDGSAARDSPDRAIEAFDLLASRSPSCRVPDQIRTFVGAATWRQDEHRIGMLRPPLVHTYLLAWDVSGLSTASFYYYAPSESLILVRTLAHDTAFRVAARDRDLTTFNGLIVLCGSITYDGETSGERRYRDLLIAAGMLCERAIREGTAEGMYIQTLTDFFDDALGIEVGLNAAEQPLAAVAFRGSGTGGGVR